MTEPPPDPPDRHRLRAWFWGELFVHSHRSRRLTRWLYLRYLDARHGRGWL